MDNNDLIRKEDALEAAFIGAVTIPPNMYRQEDIIARTRECIGDHISKIPATETEEPETEELRISWEPVKEALDGIIQRTTTLVGLNPTRTDETWLWANTLAGALLEVIRKLEEEK